MWSIGEKSSVFFSAGAWLKIAILLTFTLLGSTSANAASITGSMTLGGAYTLDGGANFLSASGLNMGNVVATGTPSGILGTTVDKYDAGSVNTSPLAYDPFAAIPNLLDIGGWQLSIGTLNIGTREADSIFLTGTGQLTGSGFTDTAAVWSLSAQTTGATYSMTVTAVPVPAAIWLFGSGLFGLLGIARKKT